MPATVKSFKESVFYKSIKGKERLIQFFFRDLLNSIRYGRYGKINVPRSFERLCIDPNEVQHTHWFRRRSSGRVIGGDWDINAKPIDTIQKVKFCRHKFTSGVSWEESGIVDLMLDEVKSVVSLMAVVTELMLKRVMRSLMCFLTS